MISTTLVALIRSLTGIILQIHQLRMHRTLIDDPDHQHGYNSGTGIRANVVEARPPTTYSDRPRVTVLKNDYYQWGLMTSQKDRNICGQFSDLM